MGMAATIPYYTVGDLDRFPRDEEVWLVDRVARSVEVSRELGANEVVRDVIVWRPPGLDVEVRVDLRAVFGGV